MRILLANKYFYPRGGDCIHLIFLKKLLEDHNHQVEVFSMQHPDNIESESSSFWPSLLEYSYKKPVNWKEAFMRPIFSNEVKQKWISILNAFKPDVVHLHNIHTHLTPLIAEEAWKRSIPVFWTLHDYKLICPCYSLYRKGMICEACLKNAVNVVRYCCIKDSLIGSFIGYLEALKWSRIKLEKYTTSFISPSIFLKNKMINAGYSEGRIEQLYNFLVHDDAEFILPKEDYYIYLGRLSKEKGLVTLFKAASLHPQFQLKVIGDGPLRIFLEKNFGNKNIDFLGNKSWSEIKTLVGKARFCVLPSEWLENNPLSIIESLSMGTPVLASNIGGIPEMINPHNGRLFRSGDINDLSEKIDEMMKIEDWDYQGISLSTRDIYSPEKYYQRLMSIYNRKN